MVVAKIANLSEDRPKKTASNEAVSQEEAAILLNVSRPSVQRAVQVQREAVLKVVEAVE